MFHVKRHSAATSSGRPRATCSSAARGQSRRSTRLPTCSPYPGCVDSISSQVRRESTATLGRSTDLTAHGILAIARSTRSVWDGPAGAVRCGAVRCGAVRCGAATDDQRTAAQQCVLTGPGLRNRRVSTVDVYDSPGGRRQECGSCTVHPPRRAALVAPPARFREKCSVHRRAGRATSRCSTPGDAACPVPPRLDLTASARKPSRAPQASDSANSSLTPLPRHSDGADPVRKPATNEFLAPGASSPLREAPCADHVAPGL
jgi:hypothetical protein